MKQTVDRGENHLRGGLPAGQRKRSLGLLLLGTAFAWTVGFQSNRLWLESNRFAQPHLEIGLNLAESGSFSLRRIQLPADPNASSLRPTLWSEPLYPLWLASIFRITGSDLGAIVPFQAVLHGVTTLLTYVTAAAFLPGLWAMAASLLVALDPALLSVSGLYYAENLSAALVAFTAWCLVATGLRRRPRLQALVLGVCSGLLVLSRSQLILVLPLLLLLHARTVLRAWNVKTALARAALLSLAFVLVLSPWAIRNWRVFGVPKITTSRGMLALCDKAVVAEYSPREMIAYPVARYSPRLARLLFPGQDLRRLAGGPEAMCGRYYYPLYIRQPDDEFGLDRLMGEKVFELVREHPVKYLLGLPLSLPAFLAFEHEAVSYIAEPTSRRLGQRPFLALVAVLHGYSLAAFVLAFGGVLWTRRHGGGGLRSLAWAVALFFGVHVLSAVEYRYTLTIAPLLLTFAAIGGMSWLRPSLPSPAATLEPGRPQPDPVGGDGASDRGGAS